MSRPFPENLKKNGKTVSGGQNDKPVQTAVRPWNFRNITEPSRAPAENFINFSAERKNRPPPPSTIFQGKEQEQNPMHG